MESLEVSLKIWKVVITRDSLQGQVKSLQLLYSPVFASRKVLSGKEQFEAKLLKYDDPRYYIMNSDRAVQAGMILEDQGDLFTIESVQHGKIWMEVLASRSKVATS